MEKEKLTFHVSIVPANLNGNELGWARSVSSHASREAAKEAADQLWEERTPLFTEGGQKIIIHTNDEIL